MKRILILNGSHSDIPLIQEAKNLGFYVITAGNKPELIGHKYADEYCSVDFSNKELVLQKAKELKIDAICACANDFGAISAAYVGEKLGLKGHDSYETTLILHHKDKFKEFCNKNKIMSPKAQSFCDINEALNQHYEKYPLIIKPVDLTGGKGVSRVDNKADYDRAIKKAFELSRQKRVVVEPFIDGTYHSFSTFIVDKKVILNFSDNEYSYKNPFLVSSSASPADNIDLVKEKLIEQCEKIATTLNLADGILHTQYIMQDLNPYIIEMTRRCSGDFYSEVVSHSLGVNWAKFIVMAESGMSCKGLKDKFLGAKFEPKFCGRHCIMGNKNEIVKDIEIDLKIKNNIYKEFIWFKNGDRIDDFMVDKLGIVFLRYTSREEMLKKTRQINELICVRYV